MSGSNPKEYWPRTSSMMRDRPTEPVEGGLTIIGAGVGRTGTSSLQEALEILGYGPCYHMRDVFKDPKGVDKWDKVGRNGVGVGVDACIKNENENENESPWEEIFHGYRSTVDFPASAYWYELTQHYPDAKVILTVRDEEKWWTSFHQTICPAHALPAFLSQITLVNRFKSRRMMRNTWIGRVFGGVAGARDKAHAIASFNAHNELVKKVVPKDKLLVMNVKEGWKPLCEFLGCAEPEVPFPRAWETEHFKAVVQISRRKVVRRLLGGGLTVMAVGYALFRRVK